MVISSHGLNALTNPGSAFPTQCQKWLLAGLNRARLVPPYVYFLAFFILIIGFTFFYVSVTFNPDELSDGYSGTMAASSPACGRARPLPPFSGTCGARPTVPGSIDPALVALLAPVALDMAGLGQDLQFSGVSLLIMAGVGLDTFKQIQGQLEQHSYQGFLR